MGDMSVGNIPGGPLAPELLAQINENLPKQGHKTNPDPVVIGVGGLLTSGKDAFAEALRSNGHLADSEYEFVVMGMSQPLNDVLMTLNPIVPGERWGVFGKKRFNMRYRDYVDLHGYTKAKEHPEVRRLLQVMGTEVGREMIHNDLWVKMADDRIQEHLDAGVSVVITGVRFRNELDMIHRRARGVSVWVTRPGVESTGQHASETSVSESDFMLTVRNNGSLTDLEWAAERLTRGEIGNNGILTLMCGGKHFNGDEQREVPEGFPRERSLIDARRHSSAWMSPTGEGPSHARYADYA